MVRLRMQAVALIAAVSTVGAFSLAGCATSADNPGPSSDSTQLASPASNPPNLPALSQCPGNDGPSGQGTDACMYGVNVAQMYTGVGQLGPAPLTLGSSSSSSYSTVESQFPKTWGASDQGAPAVCPAVSGSLWCAEASMNSIDRDNAQVSMTGTYSTPAVFGSSETVQLNNAASSNDGNQSSCVTQSYFTCALVLKEPNTPTPNTVVYLNNAPLTIMVANNLNNPNDTMSVTQVPQGSNVKVDSTGSSLNTTSDSIAPGAVGYVGTYLPTSLAKLQNPNQVSVTFALEVSSSSGDNLGGTSIAINATIKNQTVDLSSPSTLCNVQVNGTGFAYCSPTVVGAPGAAQTLVLNITEFQTP